MTTIFISRDLTPDSCFLQRLSAPDRHIVGLSLVELQRKPFAALPAADWLFFYSSNGVDFFFQTLRLQQIFVSSSLRWAAIGVATARRLEFYNQKVDFIGNGDPDTTALAFEKVAAGQTVLFLQAEQSQQSIAQRLQNSIQSHALSVYYNQTKTNFSIPPPDIAVLTSPLNAQAFLQVFNPKMYTQKIVSIGNTTAQILASYGVSDYKIAPNPSETALADTVFSLLDEKK